MKTAVALFDDALAANAVAQELLDSGIGPDALSLVLSDAAARSAPPAQLSQELKGPLGSGPIDIESLYNDLNRIGVPPGEAEAYAEGVRRGGNLVVVRAEDEPAERAGAILKRGAVDVADRERRWRERGWAGYDRTAAPYSVEEAERERAAHTAP
jgi:hypothetical protein